MSFWYVIKTRPKKEKVALSHLKVAGYELFLPQIEGVAKPKPLFPSYLFVYADLRKDNQHRFVRYARGVGHILGDDQGPRPIDSVIVETLRGQTGDGSLIEQKFLLKQGDIIRVRRGILKDLVGIIERHLPDQKRIQVLFKWWSTSLRAKLKCTDLERAA